MGAGASAQPGQVQPDPVLEKKHIELEAKHGDLDKKVTRQVLEQDSKVKDVLEKESKRIEGVIETKTKGFHDVLTDHARAQAKELTALQEAIQSQLDQAMRRIEAVEPQMQRFREELDQASTSAAADRKEMREEFRASLESATAAAEKQASDLDAQHKVHAEEQAKLNKSLRSDIAEVFDRCETLQAAINALQRDQEAMKADAKKVQEEFFGAQKTLEKHCENMQSKTQDHILSEVKRNLDAVEEKRRQQAGDISTVDGLVRANIEALKTTRAVAESVHARSMVWRLHSFSKRLAALLSQEDDTCFQSPNFTVSALPFMRLELQIGARDGGGSLDTPVPLPCVPVPVPGTCTVRLWAPAGMQLVFRLTMGEGANAVVKRFDYTFRPEASAGLPDEQGRYCFAMQNFVQLDNIWLKSSDSIQVSFDLLEFKCAPVSLGRSFESTRRPALGDGASTASEDVGSAAGEASPPAEGGGPPALSGSRKPSFLEPANPFGAVGGDDVDELAFGRSGTSEVLLEERVRNELQAIRNRSVRRVEWRLEGVQRMLDLCKIGESVDSPPFCAAGLERIVFHFYPRGYDVGSTAGVMTPCALFISGPVRTMVRGMLHVGSLARALEHKFRGKGDTGGRNKFGPLETQLDATDSILIALEVSDVETDLPDLNASLVLRDAGDKGLAKSYASPMKGGDRSGKLSGEASPVIRQGDRPVTDASPPILGKGTLRAKREDPTKTEELIRCVSLPTLNARQLHMPLIKGGRKASAFAC